MVSVYVYIPSTLHNEQHTIHNILYIYTIDRLYNAIIYTYYTQYYMVP